MNNNVFPCYLKNMFLLNIDIPKLMEDGRTRDILKSKGYSDKVFVLPEDYQSALH
jgi:hypothetical protein